VTEYDVCRKRGDTFAELFQLKVNGAAQDITGDDILLTVNSDRYPADTTNELFQVIATHVDDANGIFSVAPGAGQPADPGTYYYDIQWDDGSQIRTILQGKWTVEQDITK
jgi:hypothetical protein